MKRRTLDELGPPEGVRVRVFFPHGVGSRVMVASGETRVGSTDRYDFDHRMYDECGPSSRVEWVPGWYVCVPAGNRRTV